MSRKSRFCRDCGAPIIGGTLCQPCLTDRKYQKGLIKVMDYWIVNPLPEPPPKKEVECWFCDRKFYFIEPTFYNTPSVYEGNAACSHCINGFYRDYTKTISQCIPMLTYIKYAQRYKSEVNAALLAAENEFNLLQSKGTPVLYVHYENITIAGQPYIKFKFSSSATAAKVYGKQSFADIKSCVDLIKQIPAAFRIYESTTRFWTVQSASFTLLKGLWTSMNKVYDDFRGGFVAHADLKRWNDGLEGVVLENEKTPPKPEDFFYSTQQPVGLPKVDKETARKLVYEFMLTEVPNLPNVDDLDKLYKFSARKLHPDLNGGDVRKMTELNFLFQQYKSFV